MHKFLFSFAIVPFVFACGGVETPKETKGPVVSDPGSETPAACEYPTGDYGYEVGKTIPPTLTFQGYGAAGTDAVVEFHATDIFDCDGSKGINAIMIDEGAEWCGYCQQEAQGMTGEVRSQWGGDGVAVLNLVIENKSSQPADLPTAERWRTTYSLTDIVVGADPKKQLLLPGISNGLPINITVDPRTMKVTYRGNGYNSSAVNGALSSLVTTNRPQ